MFCDMMFSTLNYLAFNISYWCNGGHSAFVRCWTALIFLTLVVALISFSLNVVLRLWRYYEESAFTQLYQAIEDNNTAKALFIINAHSEYINKFKRPEGYTPFMVACANANTQLVKYMLLKGADIHLKSKSNETPFYLAAFYYIQNKDCKNATCIRALYYAGANINEPGKNNLTVLQMAAIFGHTPLIKWLLMKNVDMQTRPHPYILAKTQGHQEAANLIASSMKLKSLQY